MAEMRIDRDEEDVDWGPLEAILPLEDLGGFMYMCWIEVDGLRLHHYKHSITRRYLFVNDALQTYRYLGGERYVPQGRKRAIRHVLGDRSAFGF